MRNRTELMFQVVIFKFMREASGGRTSASPENKCMHSRGVGSCFSPRGLLGRLGTRPPPSTDSLQEPSPTPQAGERESKGLITYRRPLSRGGLHTHLDASNISSSCHRNVEEVSDF